MCWPNVFTSVRDTDSCNANTGAAGRPAVEEPDGTNNTKKTGHGKRQRKPKKYYGDVWVN